MNKQAPIYKLGQSTAVNISVELKGFDGHCGLSARAIATWLEKVPARHLQQLRTIEYEHLPQRPLFGFWRQHRRGGHYDAKHCKIVIYPNNNTECLLHTLFHELGHSVYFKSISANLRKQWVTQLAGRKKRFVSLYAQRNAAEDFAECYAFYVLQPEELSLISTKYHFFKDAVFGNHSAKMLRSKILDFLA